MTTTAVRTSLIPIYTYPTKISIKITLKSIQNDIFVVYIMSIHTHHSMITFDDYMVIMIAQYWRLDRSAG